MEYVNFAQAHPCRDPDAADNQHALGDGEHHALDGHVLSEKPEHSVLSTCSYPGSTTRSRRRKPNDEGRTPAQFRRSECSSSRKTKRGCGLACKTRAQNR